MRLPFGLSAYSRANGRLAPVRLLNQYAEQSPTSPGGVVLLARPGLSSLYARSDVRGIYREDGVFSGALFYVAATALYSNNSTVGTIAGTDRAQFAYTVDGLFILGGGIVYQYDGTTLTATDFPDDALASSITQLDNILVAVRADTGAVYFRLPGDTVWGALDFFSAEREPDPAICVKALTDTLYVFGTSSIEPFVPTGSPTTPFQRLQGASIARGCSSRDSVVDADNTLMWVGEDKIAYRLDGVPVPISEDGVTAQIGLSTTTSAWTFTVAKHPFYVLQLDGETLAYDISSGVVVPRWIQLTHADGAFPPNGFYDGRTAYVGGAKVWTLTDRPDDDGEAMERLFTYVIATADPLSCDCIEVELSPGVTAVGDEPAMIQHRFSDDQGRSWSDWIEAATGFGGDYRKRVRFRRLGMVDAPGRLGEVRTTDPTSLRFSGVEMNPPGGGRSRG